ncbi:MAG: 50S ribosomal protein L2 [Candidatus Nanoarchaeia archaeon]
MGKRLIMQARGKGGPRYRAKSHRWLGTIEYPAPAKELLKGEVIEIANSSGHSAPLMIVKYENGDTALLPAPLGIKVGAVVYAGAGAPIEIGNIIPISEIPSGYPINSIERIPYNGPELVRTSGSAATIVGKEAGKVLVRLPSKQTLLLDPRCRATIGVIAGGGRPEKPWVKAGKKFIALRAKGGRIFPRVAGVAMNAVDHPFGGTHRRTKGRPTTTRKWGIPPGRKVGLLGARKTGRGK